ncbi:hypothetical protein CEXT_475601 [Caerostris extrusa]|uniref:Uncharacterized protein n=1 Tax=Caerostris extrusa TaxID=172846 RepID=A0AAV4QCQ7_CAEEX|nr:hypothetical protein CEXT_475601 [Caerostris extrusa]
MKAKGQSDGNQTYIHSGRKSTISPLWMEIDTVSVLDGYRLSLHCGQKSLVSLIALISVHSEITIDFLPHWRD